MRALLFDLDGTLTRSAGGGTRALGQALRARPQAAGELRKMRAIPLDQRMRSVTDADIDAVLARSLEALTQECAQRAYEPLPGVAALLERLQARGGVLLGLCTGNLARGAELKLTSAGLWSAFRFGGYGSDAEPRAEIVRAAWARGRELGAAEGLVIGDTPRDILAAHDAGLPACGVATGRYTVHELAEHGAELVLEGFGDAAQAERLLLGPL